MESVTIWISSLPSTRSVEINHPCVSGIPIPPDIAIYATLPKAHTALKGSLHTIQPLYQHRGQPLLDETAALRAWLRKRPADGSDYLFTSQKGGKLDRTQFFRNFQTVAESAGLPVEKRHPHVLKHSLASHLVAASCMVGLERASGFDRMGPEANRQIQVSHLQE